MTHPFQNPDLPLETRIDDLVGRMTLLEKISQLVHDSRAIERLGVPAYNWWNEACHGVGRAGKATVFPQVIGLGATWNRELVHRVASTISDEARAKHHTAVKAGRRGQYSGLTFWTPNINIFRDPRWGRGQETFGEDPYLTSELGVAMVRGLQGDHPRYMKAAACAKHFAVHSGPEHLRHEFDARPSPKDFAETYLPAFERLVRAGVETVMGAYNRVNGEPACGSKQLLVDILRGQWGFKGHVVSDCFALDDFHLHHKVTNDAAASAALAIKMGCDLNCGCTYNELVVSVKEGLITEREIDTSLRRLISAKIRLGLLDPEERVPWSQTPATIVDSPPHRALARAAAVESIVLLKNNGVLPLRRDTDSILIAGPTAADAIALLGNYYGVSAQLVTIVEGITEAASDITRIVYRTATPVTGNNAPGINYTFMTATENDITIAVLGLNPNLEGEEGDTPSSPTGGDRAMIELPRVQLEFLTELRKHAKKLILVLTGGSAIAIPEAHEFCDAVMQVWYPGCEGGRAVADVIFGAASPSGRMPVTVPRRTADLPPFEDYAMHGRTYRFATVEPLYPFGFGLSYAKFSYGELSLAASPASSSAERDAASGAPTAVLAGGQSLTVRATIRNVSEIAGDEVAQCYLVPPQDWPEAPRSILIDFRKVHIAPHENARVEFTLQPEAFLQVDAAGQRVRVAGRFGVVVGPASPGPRAPALGAPVAVSSTVVLI